MRIPVTHEQASTLHPTEYASLKVQFAGIKSKSYKGFEKLSLSYAMCERVEGGSLADIFKPRAVLTIEDKMKAFLKNAFVSLEASTGRLSRQVALANIPQSIQDARRASLEKEDKEHKRFEKLTPAEKEKETTELLKQLAGSGFVAVNPTGMLRRASKAAGVKII